MLALAPMLAPRNTSELAPMNALAPTAIGSIARLVDDRVVAAVVAVVGVKEARALADRHVVADLDALRRVQRDLRSDLDTATEGELARRVEKAVVADPCPRPDPDRAAPHPRTRAGLKGHLVSELEGGLRGAQAQVARRRSDGPHVHEAKLADFRPLRPYPWFVRIAAPMPA